MLQIGLNRDVAARLAVNEWAELNDELRDSDVNDRTMTPFVVGMVRDLVVHHAEPHAQELLYVIGDDTAQPHVFADFQCDGEGSITNDGHLCLSVMVGAAPLIMDTGIDDVRELPLPADITQLDAVVVLTAVIDHLNSLLRRAAAVFGARPASRAEPIEHRVLTAEGVRGEADDNPTLSDTARQRLRDVSDDDIEDAIMGCWKQVEDRFFEVHDELQTAVVAMLTA
ncbi:hypothetical protein [Prescottella subtropica]|uniref:hypothetical protein n=1 Tax=Prescottella subtropica TaxID=2545757 RepID=UPI0010F8355C|nr:hypothetical protein [Prescottella subtropica]